MEKCGSLSKASFSIWTVTLVSSVILLSLAHHLFFPTLLGPFYYRKMFRIFNLNPCSSLRILSFLKKSFVSPPTHGHSPKTLSFSVHSSTPDCFYNSVPNTFNQSINGNKTKQKKTKRWGLSVKPMINFKDHSMNSCLRKTTHLKGQLVMAAADISHWCHPILDLKAISLPQQSLDSIYCGNSHFSEALSPGFCDFFWHSFHLISHSSDCTLIYKTPRDWV